MLLSEDWFMVIVMLFVVFIIVVSIGMSGFVWYSGGVIILI